MEKWDGLFAKRKQRPPVAEDSSLDVEVADDDVGVREGVLSLAELAAPGILSQLLTILAQVIASVVVGNVLGPDALSAVGLGLRFVGTLGVKVGTGMACALDTLCSQEHGRDPTSSAHGAHVQRCLLALSVVVAVTFVLFVTTPLYFPSVFRSAIGVMAPQFIVFGSLYLIPLFVTTCVTKLLNSLGIAHLVPIAAVVSVVAVRQCAGRHIRFVRVAFDNQPNTELAIFVIFADAFGG